MKIAFVGLPLAALLLAADGHEIVWAGICRKDAPGTGFDYTELDAMAERLWSETQAMAAASAAFAS